MSTAQTIPTEVIQQIFALFSTTFTAHDPALFPWFLGHVCSRWRSIFLDMTTEFWHTIHIAFHWEDTSKPAKNLIQFFLECDPTAPFSFCIRFPGALAKSQPHVRDHMRQILEMLVDESMRWKQISFRVADTPMTHLLPLTRAKDRLPLLQKLQLSYLSYSVPLPLLDVFQSAPSLNVIQMSNPGNWKFDWSTLKVVEVNQLGSGTCDFIPALSQMTNLERLRITSAFRGAVQSDSVVLLPRLAALKCGPSWLAFLRAPALTALTLYVGARKKSNTSDIVLSFLLRSSCNVLHLCITGGEAAAAVEVVRHTPRITRLELLDVDGVERALEKLIISSDPAQPREPLARHLLSLHIRSDFKDDIQRVMPRLISSRTGAAGCKRLQELGVSIPQFNLAADTIGNLIALCKERGIHCFDYQRNVSYT
ncbi:hypothetical protein APHAL10511_008472 [Amanita phalloides]|nr:hypothetical protein APHAL10511_008472 [Amanita phalloides]